jgi:hypothetical protein
MQRFERKIPAVNEVRHVNPFTRQAHVTPGREATLRFFEIEQEGRTLRWSSGKLDGRVSRSRKEFASEEEATFERLRRIATVTRASFVEVAAPMRRAPGSALLIDEYFAAGDPRFVDEVLHFAGIAKLASLASPWFVDARPFARTALLTYIDDGCDRPMHKALVKRLFRLAESSGDDEVMAHFMVAFDRLARRFLAQVDTRWNPVTRIPEPIQGLRRDPSVPGRLRVDANGKPRSSARFTRVTRHYLARRAFRYFRHLGHRDIARYGIAVRNALVLYRDEHLETAAQLLDAWGLMHVLYGYSPVIEKCPRGLKLKSGRAFSELTPAPYFANAWEGVFAELFATLLRAGSAAVRAWTTHVLRTNYSTEWRLLDFGHVKLLLESPHADLQALGVACFANTKGLASLSVAEWMNLLSLEAVDVLDAVCNAVRVHVNPARVTLAQCTRLGLAKAASVAHLGFTWTREKPVRDEADLREVLRLCLAPVRDVRRDASDWCATLLGSLPCATSLHVRDLCDATLAEARAAGVKCLATIERFKRDLSLWFALTESPHDDVRTFILSHVTNWKNEATPSTLAHVWASALLAIHRGGVAKQRVPRDLAERMASYPNEAETLLPILGFALRSVRPNERAAALGSLARVATKNARVRELAKKHLPEVSFTDQVTA